MKASNLFPVVLASLLALSAPARAAFGEYDSSYGTAGIAKIGLGGSYNAVKAMVRSGTSVFVCGHQMNSVDDFFVAKLTPSGSLDTSFGGGTGYVITAVSPQVDVAYAIAIQPVDGKIVVAGDADTGSGRDCAVVRYNANGTLDTSFGGGDGIFTFERPGSAGDDYIYAMDLAPDGKIVVAGNSDQGAGFFGGILTRLTTTGELDTTFGDDGMVLFDHYIDSEILNGVAVRDDGKILVVGRGENNGYAYLLQFNSNGTLDTGFGGGDGITPIKPEVVALSVTAEPSELVILPDGKILVAGSSYDGESSRFALWRFGSKGAPDTTFGTKGRTIDDISPSNDSIKALLVQPNGRILVSGQVGDYTAVVSYSPNGVIEQSQYLGNELSGSNQGNAILLQEDAKILIGGGEPSEAPTQFAVVRLDNGPENLVDAMIGTNTLLKGDDVYDASALGQLFKTKVALGTVRQARVVVENDGIAADSFTLGATVSGSGFRTTFWEGANNVTAALIAGTYVTPQLQPGEEFTLTVKVRAARARSTQNIVFQTSSVGDGTVRDAVQLKAICP